MYWAAQVGGAFFLVWCVCCSVGPFCCPGGWCGFVWYGACVVWLVGFVVQLGGVVFVWRGACVVRLVRVVAPVSGACFVWLVGFVVQVGCVVFVLRGVCVV